MGALKELMNQKSQAVNSSPSPDEETDANFRELVERVRWKLFNELSDKEECPIGDDAGYIPPSHRWLPLVQEAAAKLAQAEAAASAEIPKAIQWEMKKTAMQGGDGFRSQLGNPAVRRFLQILTAAGFVKAVALELANEGRPRQPRNLKLVPHRKSDDR